MPKLSKKIIANIAGFGVASAFIVPISLGINSATKEHKYSNYNGELVKHTEDLKLAGDNKIPEITNAYFDFDNKKKTIPRLKEWQALVAGPQNNQAKSEEAAIAKEIDATYEAIRKESGANPTIVLETKIMKIKNNYFDMFGWKETTDFFNWFLNDVSWGPDLLTLREFDIVRGVSKDGGVITLGGHSGDRGSTMIKFYPDSFFGVQNIYDGSAKSILVDASNLNLKGNKDIINRYTDPFIEKLAKWKDDLFSKDFETNENISKEILNVKTIEDYIQIFNPTTITSLSTAPQVEGTTADKQMLSVDGGFPSLKSFLTYIEGKGELISRDTVKDSTGNSSIVYPKRYLRRLLIIMYGQFDKDEIENQDIARKKIESGNLKYSDYYKSGDNSQFNALLEGKVETTLTKGAADIKDNIHPLDGVTNVVIKPYSEIVDFKTSDKDKKAGATGPFVLDDFNNFNADLPKSKAVEIGSIIRQFTKMNVVRTITSADKGVDGANKVSLLFEKYQNLIETMVDYKAEHNWSPVSFTDGVPNLTEFIPNLYLYKYQKRDHGFLEYAVSSTNAFNDEEVQTAKFLQQEIKKYNIDFDKEDIDINNPKTTRTPADLTKATGSSYDIDLAKVLRDIPTGINQPLVEKYFEYEARSKTKIKSIGIEWIKYVASHEYGHHQTLQYARDISDTKEKPKEGYTGVYNISPDEIVSGATINGHGYSDTYSRNYLNDYLRARSGIIPNLKSEDGYTKLDQTIATMQVDTRASKDDPYYTFLLNQGGKNRFTSDETATDKPIEKGAYSYADFLNSWRAFKNPDQFLEALKIKPEELKDLRGKLEGESNIAYVAYLLNSLDEASFSLNPSIMAPIAPFSEDTNRLIDPMTTNAEEASKINPLNCLNGWTGPYGSDGSISPSIQSLGLDPTLAYNTLVYKNGADPKDSIVKRLATKSAGGGLVYHNMPIPTTVASDMAETVKDITLGDTAKSLFQDDNILSPTTGASSYSVVPAVSAGIKSIDFKYDADIRKATDIFVNLKVDYSGGKPVYYLPDDSKAPSGSVEEKVFISSSTFETVPLIGTTKKKIAVLVSEAYNKANGTDSWDHATAEERYDFFTHFVVEQINLDQNRELSVNLPIAQLSGGKASFTEWFEKGAGLAGSSASQNAVFKKSYGEYLFQTYYKNFGRFLEFHKSFEEASTSNEIVPTTYLVSIVGITKASENKLNDVYAAYLSEGSYALFGQLLADYQNNFAETINRDLNQLIYSPSTKLLQDGKSTEAYSGLDFSLPPIFTSTFGSFGKIEFTPGTGSYDKNTKVLKSAMVSSGFFEDVALRRELDASLYILDIDEIEKYYRKAISDDLTSYNAGSVKPGDKKPEHKYKDKDGNPIIDPEKWHDAFDRYGHPLSTTGKAMVNFYKETSGATLDRDLSGFYIDGYTGQGQMFGYISKHDAEKYDHIALVAPDGSVEYIGMTKNMSNQFFNRSMRAADTESEGQKVPIGSGYFDTKGDWVDYKHDDVQIGWSSDKFLSDSYANALIKDGTSYKIYFTKGESLTTKRTIKLGSVDVFTAQADGTYGTTHEPREIMYNNGYDVYSGKFEITVEDGVTVLRVRGQGDE